MTTTSEDVSALLSSPDFGDRLRGVTQLRQLEPNIAFSLVVPLVEDVHPRVRYSAVSQLASLGQQDRVRSLVLLRTRLQDSEPDVQAAAADSLGALGLKEAFEDLQKLYQTSSEWLVSFSIVAALGALGDPRGFDLLVDALESNNEMLQTVAIGSLGELGDPRAASLIAPYASHPDWQIRFRVAQALGVFKLPEYRSTLETLAKDEIDIVAQEAQRNLA
jgi:HEAT repeat protein